MSVAALALLALAASAAYLAGRDSRPRPRGPWGDETSPLPPLGATLILLPPERVPVPAPLPPEPSLN